MKTEPKIELFAQGEASLHFVVGVSGFIMKELGNDSATVFCWESEQSANEFISTKFSGNQRKLYEVQLLDNKEFGELRHTIKWLPANAEVNVEFYSSRTTT